MYSVKKSNTMSNALILIVLAVLVVVFSVPIFAFVISLLQNIITTIALVLVLGLMIYVILDPKFRNLVWYMYKSFMRWVTSVFVQIDPIKILETYIEYLYKNLREMNVHIAKLKGQISKLKAVILKNKKEMEQNLKMAEQAKKKGKKELVVVSTRQYGRLKESN